MLRRIKQKFRPVRIQKKYKDTEYPVYQPSPKTMIKINKRKCEVCKKKVEKGEPEVELGCKCHYHLGCYLSDCKSMTECMKCGAPIH